MESFEEREWAIFIYANGNNELAPEIMENLFSLRRCDLSNLHLVVQFSHMDGRIMDLMRPSTIKKNLLYPEGMVRYSIDSSKEGFKEYLYEKGSVVNMANAHLLYDFIAWGVRTFPALHYILMVSGHGAGFLGVLADYSTGSPLLMSIPALAKTLQRVERTLSPGFCLIILDLCLMNSIEVLYELAFTGQFYNQLLLFPVVAPVEGLSYAKIVDSIQYRREIPGENRDYCFHHLARTLQNNSEEEVILLRLKRSSLEAIKFCYEKATEEKGILSLLSLSQERILKMKREIDRRSNSMILYPREEGSYLTFYTPQTIKEYLSYREYYHRLAFTEIGKKSVKKGPLFNKIPVRMMIDTLHILRPDLTEEELVERIEELGWYR